MGFLFVFLFKYDLFLFEKGRLIFDPALPKRLWLGLAFGTVLTALLVYSFRPAHRWASGARQSVSAKRRMWLISLRAIALALLFLIISRPTLVVSALLPQENLVAVLVDGSQSMGVRDVDGGRRVEAIGHLLDQEQSDFLGDLQKRFQTRFFMFSADSRRLGSFTEIEAEGRLTNLETALQTVSREFVQEPLASVLILSDGADNASSDLDRVLSDYRARGISISTVGVGQVAMRGDVEITQVAGPMQVLPGSTVQVVVSLKSNGLAGQDAVVEIRRQGRLVNSEPVKLAGNDEPQVVELDLIPREAGLQAYTVAVTNQPGEPITENNRRDLILNVEDSHPQILYLEGTPRWEFKFLRQALLKDENLHLVTLLRTTANRFYRQGVENEDSLATGFPTSREELFRYKGLILGSVESSFFSREQLRMVADFVGTRGGGLMVLGGKDSFDGGGYYDTPVAEVLPVVLPSQGPSSYRRQPVKLELTAYGKKHPVTRLAKDEVQNDQRWKQLPEVADFNLILSTKPGAVALARAGGKNGGPILLAAQHFGRGRVLAFTGAGSWRWRMEMAHTDDSHELFWRQALRWVVGAAPDQVALDLEQSVYHEGETVRFRAEVNDPSFVGLNDADVTALITSPDGNTVEMPLTWSGRKDGVYLGAYRPLELGTHEVRLEAVRQGQQVGESRRFLLVTESTREFFNAAQNRRLLEHVSARTGGRYYSLQEAKRLPAELLYQERPNSVPQFLPLWDMPVLFLLLTGALLAEWCIRRKEGLA